MRTLALYASTSGSTRCVVEALASDPSASMTLIDIAKRESVFLLDGFDLIISATPTYGQGDAHYVWRDRGPEIFRAMPSGQALALISLGDARGHPQTFAGGLKVLREMAGLAGPTFFGAVPASDYVFECSTAVSNGSFPGLVLEYRRNRLAAERRAREWLRDIVGQVEATQSCRCEATRESIRHTSRSELDSVL